MNYISMLKKNPCLHELIFLLEDKENKQKYINKYGIFSVAKENYKTEWGIGSFREWMEAAIRTRVLLKALQRRFHMSRHLKEMRVQAMWGKSTPQKKQQVQRSWGRSIPIIWLNGKVSVPSDIRLVGVLPVTVLDLIPVFGTQESRVHHPILEPGPLV